MKPAPTSNLRDPRHRSITAAASRQSLVERLAGGALSAVVVCRFLTPTDAAMTGETLWIAQLALLAFLVWSFAVWRSGTLSLQFDWLDGAILLLCLGHISGALVLISTSGDKRAAMTMLWEWMGLLATFFLMRRLLLDSACRQSLLLVVASTASVLAGLGVWQHHLGFSESRHRYEELKSRLETLERGGRPGDQGAALDWDRSLVSVRSEFVRMGIPAEESVRKMWEQRLYSVEPFAFFALANTLAGILIVAVIVWLGCLVQNGRHVSRPVAAIAIVVILIMVYCLLLTKSRTAWVGLVVGLIVWGVGSRLARAEARTRLKRGIAVGIAGLVVLAMIAYSSGGLDRFVISESAKSLRYRLEYWTASWRMLVKTPQNLLLGVGPGNFRQNYLEFKLPQSSEEIADPHNLVLDVWANGGLIALVGLTGVCTLCMRSLWQTVKRSPVESRLQAASQASTPPQSTPAEYGTPARLFADGIFLGGGAAYLIVLCLGLADDATLVLLLPAWILVLIVGRPIFQGVVPTSVSAAASAALIVHLAGAGGIGMPAVTQVLLLLTVLAVPADGGLCSDTGPPESSNADGHSMAQSAAGWNYVLESRAGIATIGVIGLALYMACWFTGLMPVVTVRRLIDSAKEALFERGKPSQAERDFRIAAEFDPWSPLPCERLAELTFERWLADDDDRSENFDRCLEWQRRAIERDPRNPGGYRALGEFYLSKATRGGDPADAGAAADAFQQAVTLYPNHALTLTLLAEALWKAGKPAEARFAARRASDQDRINEQAGHTDKRLPAARRKAIDEVLEHDSN